MATVYTEPVKIEVKSSPTFTSAALNKSLFITDEHKSGDPGAANSIKVFSSSAEVGEYFGNNSKTFKAIEFFLGQKQYPAKQPLVPDFFTILSIKKDESITKEMVLQALSQLALGQTFYAIDYSALPEGTLQPGDLNSWANEYRKIVFTENTTKTTDEKNRSNRFIELYNSKNLGEQKEYKAVSYMATVITPGAGSKSDMNILSMCSPDVSGGERQELTAQNINFTEKRTSKDYVVVRTGVATDGTDITETTAIDCIIYNLLDNLEIAMAEKGFKQDSRGYSLLEDVLSKVMGEMYNMELVADENGQAAFTVYPITQTATERQLKVIRPKVLFILADFAKTIELTLERTYGEVTE